MYDVHTTFFSLLPRKSYVHTALLVYLLRFKSTHHVFAAYKEYMLRSKNLFVGNLHKVKQFTLNKLF